MSISSALLAQADALSGALSALRFGGNIAHVYNPLEYARAPHRLYLERYAATTKRVVFLGMNPGPFGMAQTGVPFGEIASVRDFLGIDAPVGRPPHEHPKRPITGFACTRSEVSGARLWGMIRQLCGTADAFFRWGFVANYCPLVFMEEGGKNLTPDKLTSRERAAVYAPCDQYLRTLVELLAPTWVVGIGKFAEGRAREALAGVQFASMPHPSPANPAANRNWSEAALSQLTAQGLDLAALQQERSKGKVGRAVRS